MKDTEWGEPHSERTARKSRDMRREAEMALLDRLRAEAAMPEWYPER